MQKGVFRKKGVNSIIMTGALILVTVVALGIVGLLFQKNLLPQFEKRVEKGFSGVAGDNVQSSIANVAPIVNAGQDQTIAFSESTAESHWAECMQLDTVKPRI